MAETNKEKHLARRTAAAAAILAATAAAGAAGYYFYASKNAKKNRQVAVKWANDLKRDVISRAKKAEQMVDKKTIARIVDETAAAYTSVRGLDRSDLKRAVQELKTNWDRIKDEIGANARAGRKRASGAVKKARSAVKNRTARKKSSS